MAESIFTLLNEGKTITSVPSQGKDEKGNVKCFQHSIPKELFPSSEQFAEDGELLAWAEEAGFTHAILQRGIQKFLIEARATFKGCKKDDIWGEDYGQANVDKMEWKIIKRPNQSGNSQAIATAVLSETVANMQLMIDVAKLGEKKITAVLLDKFDDNEGVVNAILKQLEF